MTPTESMLRRWAESGTETQKAHARRHLGRSFEPDPAPAPPTTAVPFPVRPSRRPPPDYPAASASVRRSGPSAWLARVNTCLYRDCPSGCQASQCHWRRDDFGRPGVFTLAQCKDCLASSDPPVLNSPAERGSGDG